jgi:glycosyltransferase involved in cell wall biosynthesis
MKPVRILVESMVDEDLTNAQMVNAREIIRRLDPDYFHVTTFVGGTPDPNISNRANTHLINLPLRRQTARIFAEFLLGNHDVLFYVKASPASRWYMKLRSIWKDTRLTVGTVESQSDWRYEPTIAPENIALIEQTVLRCDYLFSNSKRVKQSLESEYGLGSEIVPTGVDTNFFTPDWERPKSTRPRVLFVGSLRPFKGPQTVIEAAERFPEADFVIVGDGILAADVRAEAKRLSNLCFAGALSRTAVREEYKQADIFLFPSRWEGSPKVILEAAACGLPVIVRKDYEPETVLNGETGYVVGEDDELFCRVDQLISNPRLRQAMGRAARAHIENFDWDRVTSQWEEIFLHLAANHRGRAS